MHTCRPCLHQVLVRQAKTYHDDATVGVMVDFCSLPQLPRTDEEARVFKRGLEMMHRARMALPHRTTCQRS